MVTKGQRLAALLLLAAALALAALGQIYFFHRREYLWDGVLFYGVAVICFLLAWRVLSPPTRAERPTRSWRVGFEWVLRHPVPSLLLIAGATLSGFATLLVRPRAWDSYTGDLAAFWLAGIACVLGAAFWPSSWSRCSPRAWRSRFRCIPRTAWLEAAMVAGLAILAFALRAVSLESIPFALGGDEAWHGLLARQVLEGKLRNPFVMGYMSMPTLFYWPVSWSLWLVGDTMVGLRLPAALAGAATAPVLYLLARRLWGRRVAFLATAFLATYDYHLHYSRLGANNVWDALFVLLALWALVEGLAAKERPHQVRAYLLAGLAMGLSAYFYTGARLLPLMIGAYLLFLWLRPRLVRARETPWPGLDGRLILLLLVAFAVAAGPILGFAQAHPDDWNARVNQVGILQSGWLAREPGLTGKSTLQILAEQLGRAAGAFHVFPDRTAWYGADRPLLGFLAGMFAMLGMVWAAMHWKDRRCFLVLLWFWSVIVTGGMLTESPPSSQRLVLAIPAVALLVALGLEQTVNLARRAAGLDVHWERVALGALLLALALGSVHFYFVEFTPQRRYGTANAVTATMVGHYLEGLDAGYDAYFFGAPSIYWAFGSMTFLAPAIDGRDVVEPLSAPPDWNLDGQSTVFLFVPERAAELAWVQQRWPDGEAREFYDQEGRLRFLAYEVPPAGNP